MKILFDLQLSSVNEEGKPVITSDSNWIFTRNIMNGLRRVLDHEIEPFLLYDNDCFGEISSDELSESIMIIDMHLASLPEEGRFTFPNEIAHAIKYMEPDIIWTNDPAKVGSYKAIAPDIPVIAYNHWIDNPFHSDKRFQVMPKNRTYFWRQLEGFMKADYMLFNSQTGAENWSNGLAIFQPELFAGHAQIGIVNPPLDTELLKEAYDSVYWSDEPTLVFNHRLSSASPYKENTDAFVRFINIFRAEFGPQFKVLVSNPSQKNHPILEMPWVYNAYSPNYTEYIRNIAQGQFHFTFFDYPGQWSMSMAEALCLGLMPIYPNLWGYREIAGNSHNPKEIAWPSAAMSDKDLSLIAENMFRIMKEPIKKNNADYYLSRFSIDNVIKNQVLPILMRFKP